MGEMIEQNLKSAFSKVKQDIHLLSENLKGVEGLKAELKTQQEIIKDLSLQIKELQKSIDSIKTKSSIGNEGVNQSINHLINQSSTNQSINQDLEDLSQNNSEISQNRGNKEVNQSFNQSIKHQSINQTPQLNEKIPNNQSFNQSINQIDEKPIKTFAANINQVFLSLSKQELKLFLTIYQLEDEGIEGSYKHLSQRMQLSEPCIRSHLSSLLKKNTPIMKLRLNNNTNLISIRKDFRTLNLKQKIINLYYDSDPNQKTLLNI